jgi:hypothetical protein
VLVIVCCLFNNTVNISNYIAFNDTLASVWKEAVWPNLGTILAFISENEENRKIIGQENRCPGRYLNRVSSEYKLEVEARLAVRSSCMTKVCS